MTANFAINTYTLTYTAGANGTITGLTPQRVDHGDSGTAVTAVPQAGYHFLKWSDGVPGATRTDVASATLDVTASFAIDVCTVTYAAGSGGTISGPSRQLVDYGTDATSVIAVPDPRYHFTTWSDGVLTAERRDLGVVESRDVTARFEITTNLGLQGPPSSAYGSVTLGASLASWDGVPVEGRNLVLESSADAVNWTPVRGFASGVTTASVIAAPTAATYYRVAFPGDGTYSAAVSRVVKVKPKANVTAVSSPWSMSHARSYVAYGYLKPRHASGSHPVRIYKYRYLRGKWRSYGYVSARAFNYGTYTRYSVSREVAIRRYVAVESSGCGRRRTCRDVVGAVSDRQGVLAQPTHRRHGFRRAALPERGGRLLAFAAEESPRGLAPHAAAATAPDLRVFARGHPVKLSLRVAPPRLRPLASEPPRLVGAVLDGPSKRPGTTLHVAYTHQGVIELSRFPRHALTLLTAVLVLSLVTPAFADPISAKRAEAARVQSQIDALNTKAEIATENFNAARDRHARLTAEVNATEKRIAKLEKRTDALQVQLNSSAEQMYRQGPLGFLNVLFGATSFENFASAWDVLSEMNAQRGETVAQLRETKAEADKAHRKLVVAEKAAAKEQRAMARNERAVKQRLASRNQVLNGLNADIKSLIAQQKAREAAAERARVAALLARQRAAAAAAERAAVAQREAAQRAAAAAAAVVPQAVGAPQASQPRHRSGGGGGGGSTATGASAVRWAQSKLGSPYVWAADGPNSFDCSGLTMWAYRQVGVSLPHFAAAQINRGRRVSRGNLQPGDLVFFGSPIHHVGMYVGGGDFIHAPHTGDVVKISSLGSRGDYVGACRPTSTAERVSGDRGQQRG